MYVPEVKDVPVMTVEQVAELEGMPCSRTLRESIARGEFPARRIGRRIVIPTAELRRFLGIDPA